MQSVLGGTFSACSFCHSPEGFKLGWRFVGKADHLGPGTTHLTIIVCQSCGPEYHTKYTNNPAKFNKTPVETESFNDLWRDSVSPEDYVRTINNITTPGRIREPVHYSP